MKRVFYVILLIVLTATVAWSDGTVSEIFTKIDKQTALIKYAITGDASTGAMSAISSDDYKLSGQDYTSLIRGWDLVEVRAYPTSGGTAPDAADVTVTENSLDLLDGNGTGLIHATATKTTYPQKDGLPAHLRVLGAVTVTVTNQATASADYTIELRFEKDNR